MKIKAVNECGFERIYNALMNIKQMGFGENLDSLLNHISVSFLLADVSGIELLYLSDFCKHTKVISKSISNSSPDTYPQNIKDAISGTKSLSEQITSDMDVSEKSNGYCAMPLSSFKYNVVASLKGMNITAITGLMFKQLFRDTSENPETPYYSKYPADKMGDILAGKFLESFYKYIADRVSTIDIASEYQLHSNFFNIIKQQTGHIMLSHINTIAGDINFIDNSEQGLSDDINNIKLINVRNKNAGVLDNMEYYFTLRTSLFNFINMKTIANLVVSSESVHSLKEDENIIFTEDIINKYSNRIDESLDQVIEFRKSLPDTDINKYGLLISGQLICYNIMVTSDMKKEDIINKITKVDRIDSELEEVIDYIFTVIENMNMNISLATNLS